MRREIDLKTWYRKDHFEFFSQFDEPFFGITTRVDCTRAYEVSKEKEHSFFMSYLHKSLVASNQTAPFRYRIIDDKIYEYDSIDASPTINREDGSFGFSYMQFYEDFEAFVSGARKEMERVRN